MLVRTLFLATLENAISRFIALDPDAGRLLKPVSGKVIAIRFKNPDWTFYLCPSDHTIQLLERYEGTPDTTLKGSPLAFLSLGLNENPTGVLFAGKITIEGDLATGRRFQSLFKGLDIDWEEQLSKVTGDVPAHEIGNSLRGALRWGRESLEAMKLNITEYLQEERRDLPGPYECDEWFREVDTLRADADRLEKRIERLNMRVQRPDPEDAASGRE